MLSGPKGLHAPCTNPSGPTETASPRDFTDLSAREAGNKLLSLGTICHENNGVMSALTVTSPPASLACAAPGPTAAVRMPYTESFLAGTGRRKMPGGG